MELDDRDNRLLMALQQDCRISNGDLAQSVGMSASACWRRVRAFEEAGVIEGYGAKLAPEAAGMQFQALVQVQLTRHNPEHLQEFIAAVEKRPEVLDCYATTGQADYQMRVLCRDIGSYNRFLEGFLFRLPAVQSAQTNVILREVKRGAAIAL
ncbi:Lrp/AsnC family transcriptional regulator [Pararhodobacter oceanensis]|uniref:Lrp/AsnC family transcriptional regulator n=1 Tax=Pararhodobacter oceanensis TaxID=2172121 RepID=UPI003A9598A3